MLSWANIRTTAVIKRSLDLSFLILIAILRLHRLPKRILRSLRSDVMILGIMHNGGALACGCLEQREYRLTGGHHVKSLGMHEVTLTSAGA
jgi:hypothetical protein